MPVQNRLDLSGIKLEGTVIFKALVVILDNFYHMSHFKAMVTPLGFWYY